MAVETSLEKEESIRAWAGGKQDLIRLGEVIDGRFTDVRDGALKELTQELQESVNRNWLGRETKKSKLATQQKIRQASRDWEVKLELKDKENKLLKDEYRALLEKTELRNIPQITLSCSVDGQTCILRLSDGGLPGSSLRVAGEPAWTRETFATVWSALTTNRPAWAIMRHPVVGWFVPLILFAAGFAVLISGWVDRLPDWVQWPLYITPWLLPFLVILIGMQLFPPFELTETGKRTPRQRAIRVGAALVASVVTISTVASALFGVFNRPQ